MAGFLKYRVRAAKLAQLAQVLALKPLKPFEGQNCPGQGALGGTEAPSPQRSQTSFESLSDYCLRTRTNCSLLIGETSSGQ